MRQLSLPSDLLHQNCQSWNTNCYISKAKLVIFCLVNFEVLFERLGHLLTAGEETLHVVPLGEALLIDRCLIHETLLVSSKIHYKC